MIRAVRKRKQEDGVEIDWRGKESLVNIGSELKPNVREDAYQ